MKVWFIFWFRFGSSNLTDVTKRHPGGCEVNDCILRESFGKKTLEVKETAIEKIVPPGSVDSTLCLQTPCEWVFGPQKHTIQTPNLGRYDWKIGCKPLLFQCRLYGKKRFHSTNCRHLGLPGWNWQLPICSQRLNAELVYSPPRYFHVQYVHWYIYLSNWVVGTGCFFCIGF